MAYENILYDVQDGIAVITFNRPKALNALNAALVAEFSDAIDAVSQDTDIRALILTGAGGKSFVAGADISELATLDTTKAKSLSAKGQDIICRLESLAIPVIAAVNGFALGGGCEISLACDFIYAAETAKFGLPEITLGLIPGYGGTQRLPRLIGKNLAKELILTGKMLSAAEAKEIGLVNKVCEPDTLIETVMGVAKAIAAKGKVSVRAAKQAVNNGLNVDLPNGLKMETDAFAICFSSEDAIEGTSAFLEKRKALFKGSI